MNPSSNKPSLVATVWPWAWLVVALAVYAAQFSSLIGPILQTLGLGSVLRMDALRPILQLLGVNP